MCGIHLILDKQSKLRPAAVVQMAEATTHRGPDACQTYFVPTPRQTLLLGHNRLKITDLRDEANQPMATPGGQYRLIFNGAIYNFRQLRAKLSRKYAFRTESDTEVLLYWLAEHGQSGLASLDGMYALAFYDCGTEQLLLARDPWGMKPLFYFENHQYLIVSSEIRGILASGLVPKEPEPGQVSHYLQFKFAQRPGTFYRNIFELEPGGAYLSAPGKKLARMTDHEIATPKEAEPEDHQPVLASLSQNLSETVSRHLVADVPAGLFLSGGVDSTLLLALAHQAGVKGLPAYTIAYGREDKPYATQDHHFARMAARQYSAELHEVPVSRRLLDSFHEWLPTLDQPIGDGAAWLTWLLAQEARRHVTVVLSGAGADELFGGYNRHQAFHQYLKAYRWLKYCTPALQKAASLMPNRTGLRHWHKLASQLHRQPAQTFVNFTAHLPGMLVKQEYANIGEPDWDRERAWPEGAAGQASRFVEENLRSALYHDQRYYLSGDVLALTDRMSMQHGMEARLPYLGRKITQLANSLPAVYRLQYGRKWLLKDMLKKLGGKAYVSRPKEGFGMPFGHWLRTPAGRPLTELLTNQQSAIFDVISYASAAELLGLHIAGRRDYSSELWTLLVLAGWMEGEFGKAGPGGQRRYISPQLVRVNQ